MSYTGKTIDLSKYDKYGKEVELSKMEVELSDINELSKKIKDLNGYVKMLQFEVDEGERFIKEKKNIENYLSKVVNDIKLISKSTQQLGSLELTIAKKAKELGINEDSIKEIKESKETRNSLNNREQEISNIIKQLK